MIDLRSDTLTTPDQGMRAAMAAAVVADDVYGEDPTVNTLQDRVAAMFGKEAALFVPSGTMGNQICLALHGGAGDEVIAEHHAHIFHYENGAASTISRMQVHRIASEAGAMQLADIEEAIRPREYYYPRTKLIAVENTHNRHGGTVLSMDYLRALSTFARERSIALHCDGARIWNACTYLGVSYHHMAECFDTMSVCLSKGVGAPVGSLILGSRGHIEQARRWRKMLGGGLRQSGVLAAAASYALDEVLPKLAQDHANAKAFASIISEEPSITIDLDRVQTNIVVFRVPMDDGEFLEKTRTRGVRLGLISPGVVRAVFYHQIESSQAVEAANEVVAVVRNR